MPRDEHPSRASATLARVLGLRGNSSCGHSAAVENLGCGNRSGGTKTVGNSPGIASGESSRPRLTTDGGLADLLALRGVPSRGSRRRPLRHGEPGGNTAHSCSTSGRQLLPLCRGLRVRSSARTTRSAVAGNVAEGLPAPAGCWPSAALGKLGLKFGSRMLCHTVRVCSWMPVELTCASESDCARDLFSRRASSSCWVKRSCRSMLSGTCFSSELVRSLQAHGSLRTPGESSVTKPSIRTFTRLSAESLYLVVATTVWLSQRPSDSCNWSVPSSCPRSSIRAQICASCSFSLFRLPQSERSNFCRKSPSRFLEASRLLAKSSMSRRRFS
mmetsp:Transcript_85940/g.256312  ORF Transcript_85940/g.256312 Transcript_85940/m.256312 type:complete len:329 (-) Transcript_85940:362-1348(-)